MNRIFEDSEKRKFLRKNLIAAAQVEYQRQQQECGSVAAISPSPSDLIDTIVQDLHTEHPTLRAFVDMGCGDGRWLFALSASYPQSLAFGVDVDRERLSLAMRNSSWQGTARIELVNCRFEEFPVSLVDLVVVYLSRHGNDVVKAQLERECAKGTLVVAVGFQMTGWVCVKTYQSASTRIKAYLYLI